MAETIIYAPYQQIVASRVAVVPPGEYRLSVDVWRQTDGQMDRRTWSLLYRAGGAQ